MVYCQKSVITQYSIVYLYDTPKVIPKPTDIHIYLPKIPPCFSTHFNTSPSMYIAQVQGVL